MNKSVKLVLSGYMRLDGADRREFDRELRRLLESAPQERRKIEEDIRTKIDLGPLSQGKCPCCEK